MKCVLVQKAMIHLGTFSAHLHPDDGLGDVKQSPNGTGQVRHGLGINTTVRLLLLLMPIPSGLSYLEYLTEEEAHQIREQFRGLPFKSGCQVWSGVSRDWVRRCGKGSREALDVD
jgi:hypothetical protein